HHGLPEELERIVRKCLEKDRERRYPSARDLLVDLRNLKQSNGAGAAAPGARVRRRSIVVTLAIAAAALAGIGIYLGLMRGPAIDSLAVLPFVNAGGDPSTEYLSDGITENLINTFSQLPKLRVVPRSRVFRYKGRESEPEKIGRELNVRAVLTGRVVQHGDSLNIQA